MALDDESNPNLLKEEILRLTKRYSELVHKNFLPASHPRRGYWEEGTIIPYAGRVFEEEEVAAAVGSNLDFWLTLGNEGKSFESELKSFLGVKHSLLVNSGSSANLLAISALTSHKIPYKKRINPGDEVITVAAGFPTTVSPIIQNGAKAIFIDANPVTGNFCEDQLEKAYQKGKTKALMMAHALGNPFNICAALEFCKKYDLWLIEDNCDALGCTYKMPKKLANSFGFYNNSPGLEENSEFIIRWTGTWGDLSTQSFYPPHHITMGEGGAVNIISNTKLKIIIESFRDWGRDCWCPSGIDNTCKKRFDWHLGELPQGYDHKYTYSHLGYNLKPLDPQAAIGRVQLKRLKQFIKARKENWMFLRINLDKYSEFFKFSLPTHSTNWDPIIGFQWDETGCMSDCSWFGFKIEISPQAPFSRTDLAKRLDENFIGNRMLFGGNLVRQPAFVELKKNKPDSFKVATKLIGSDSLMRNAIFLGTYPGLTKEMLQYEIKVISNFIDEFKNK